MTFPIPSAANVKMKFAPAFDNTADATIEFAIEEAASCVGDGWRMDQTLAVYYLTAHFLSVAKVSAANDGREVTSERFGQISVTYKSGANSSAPQASFSDYSTTSYGARYFQIMKKNFPGFIII